MRGRRNNKRNSSQGKKSIEDTKFDGNEKKSTSKSPKNSSSQKTQQTPLKTPEVVAREKSEKRRKEENPQSKDKNNNASISTVAEKKDENNFLAKMDKKFGDKTSSKIDKTKEKKTFSILEDAIRVPFRFENEDEDIEMLSDEGEEEGDGESTPTNERINLKIAKERSSTKSSQKRMSRSKTRSPPSKRQAVREAAPEKIDLNSHPEFQLLMKELKEVKQQLQDKRDNEEEKLRSKGKLPIIKSPSEATAYSPAVKQAYGVVGKRVHNRMHINPVKLNKTGKEVREEDIENFINNIRLGDELPREQIRRKLDFEEEETQEDVIRHEP